MAHIREVDDGDFEAADGKDVAADDVVGGGEREDEFARELVGLRLQDDLAGGGPEGPFKGGHGVGWG